MGEKRRKKKKILEQENKKIKKEKLRGKKILQHLPHHDDNNIYTIKKVRIFLHIMIP